MDSSADKACQILVVEGDAKLRAAATRQLAGEGFEAATATTWGEARERLRGTDFDVVVLAQKLPGGPGLKPLEELRGGEAPPEVVVVGRSPSVDDVVTAVKRGAFGFLTQPDNSLELLQLVRRAAEKRRLAQENEALRRIVSVRGDGESIVSESAEMKAVLEKALRVAPSSASVLIYGETGSGKGLIARTLHRASPRAEQPFMHVNCGALQESLLESELFGHEKGAFTGAVSAKLGLFEVAHGGSLFLDEIAELKPPMQAKLLQVLDAGEIRRVGGTKLRQVDTRIIAATNKDLKQEVREDRFREDLFFRLNVVSLTVPPLRRRREDLPGLVDHLLDRYRGPDGTPKRMSRRALRLMMEYHWPGNVRELVNLVESLSLLTAGDTIGPEDLPANLQPFTVFESRAIDVPIPLVEIERLHIQRTLEYTAGKKAPAARLLGIDVKTLNSKIKSYKIEI